MKGLKIKETYLLFLIVIGLVTLATYSTYALFTARVEIEDVVEFSTSLTTDSSILEYEMVTIPTGETKIIELNVSNSYSDTLYYGAWYEMVSPSTINDNIELGLYTDKNNTPGSGTITSGTTLSLLVGITNNTSSDIIINIGVAGSLTNDLGLANTRIMIPSGWSDVLLVTDEVLAQHIITTEKEINLEYTTAEMNEVTLEPGTYKLEVWGAQGANYPSTDYYGGKGGYSYGTLTLTENTKLYIYVGGSGNSDSSNRTFNSGGSREGGGASDIRIGEDSLYSRVIVAGGGGSYGSSSAGSTNAKISGGYGGGLTGKIINSSNYGEGGTQISGYAFGIGGNPSDSGSGSGGGGWYGGTAGNFEYGDVGQISGPGGGGSGWIYTESSYNTWKSGNSTDAGRWLLDSSYYLTNAKTIDGGTTFTDFDGNTVTGHSGDGAARISGTTQTSYSIPVLLGLNDLEIPLGRSVNLAENVELQCASGETECSLIEISISNTAILELGNYEIYYLVQDSLGKKYKYIRKVNIVNNADIIYGATYTDKGIYLDGVDDYIMINDIDYENTTAITFDFVAKIEEEDVGIIVESSIDWNNNNNSFGIDINELETGVFCLVIKGSTGYNIKMTETLNVSDEFKHYTIIFDTTKDYNEFIDFYLDKSIKNLSIYNSYSANISNLTFSNYPLYIGARAGSSYFTEMTIKQLRIYKKSLTQEEIENNHNGNIVEDGLIINYEFVSL